MILNKIVEQICMIEKWKEKEALMKNSSYFKSFYVDSRRFGNRWNSETEFRFSFDRYATFSLIES